MRITGKSENFKTWMKMTRAKYTRFSASESRARLILSGAKLTRFNVMDPSVTDNYRLLWTKESKTRLEKFSLHKIDLVTCRTRTLSVPYFLYYKGSRKTWKPTWHHPPLFLFFIFLLAQLTDLPLKFAWASYLKVTLYLTNANHNISLSYHNRPTFPFYLKETQNRFHIASSKSVNP